MLFYVVRKYVRAMLWGVVYFFLSASIKYYNKFLASFAFHCLKKKAHVFAWAEQLKDVSIFECW